MTGEADSCVVCFEVTSDELPTGLLMRGDDASCFVLTMILFSNLSLLCLMTG